MKARKRAGFSLLETILSVGIVATCLLLIVGVFSSFLLAGTKYSNTENGVLVAQTQLEQNIYALAWGQSPYTASSAATYFADVGPTALVRGTVSVNNQVYTYAVNMTRAYVPAATSNDHLQQFDVLVTWPQSSGQGLASTSLTRLVNESIY